ncbi:MAG: DUF503 domain-containing protein [Gemmatimonadetes bacterium]|nr:DUF503 domain-containing protein [Gemmatimonadota bacterium]NNF12755.1 DUF503 domain-containing protein [Gemmatimonadota bacterium]NNL31139.1 DUF503 domain-containing protein [Gemmatimonadota bacterium]
MIVASQTWEFSIPGCSSLKEKRAVVRSMRDRLRSRYNVSVAETGLHDVHSRAELSIAIVTTDRRQAMSILDKTDQFVESLGTAVIVRVDRDFP